MSAGRLTLPYWLVYDDRRGDAAGQGDQRFDGGDRALPGGRAVAHRRHPRRTGADSIGVPAAALADTVERFNRMVADGADTPTSAAATRPGDRAFSRGKPRWCPSRPRRFHAAAFGLSDLGTKGGLRTDTRARVLDTAGRPIPGLYAAGNTMAAVSGTTLPGGGEPDRRLDAVQPSGRTRHGAERRNQE